MGEYFNNTFDNWSGDFFEAKKAFPGRRFQCDLENREEVKGNKSWQGARYVDDYKPWTKVNYDTIDWASCFNDCKIDCDFKCEPCEPCDFKCEPCDFKCEPCDFKCEPCEPCDFNCEPCEPCDFKCEPCEPCDFKCEPCEKPCKVRREKPCKVRREKEEKKDRKFWDEKTDYVHWTQDKDIWPHDYLPTVGEKKNL